MAGKPPTLGAIHIAGVRVTFPDFSSKLPSEGGFSNALTALDGRIRELSYGQSWVEGRGIYTFRLPISRYSVNCYDAGRAKIFEQILKAAAAAGVDLSSYHHFVIVGANCGNMGEIYSNPGRIWTGTSQLTNTRLLLHEWGHSAGLLHTRTFSSSCQDPLPRYGQCGAVTGDGYDTMGGGQAFNVVSRLSLKWISASNVHAYVKGVPGTYTLTPVDSQLPGLKAVLIDHPDPSWSQPAYVVCSTRSGVSGIIIHFTRTWMYGPEQRIWDSYLLDLAPGDSMGVDDPLAVGKSFTVPISGLRITALRSNAIQIE